MKNKIEHLENDGCNVQIVISYNELKVLLKELIDEYFNERIEIEKERQDGNTLLSIEKAMEMLDVSKTTIWRYTKQGLLHKIHVGSLIRYKKSEIQKLIYEES